MNCRKITTFAVNGRPVTEEEYIPVTAESEEPHHLESGVINLYPQIEYQTIEGFGGAMTETSAYLLSLLDPQERKEAMEALFGETGSRFRYIRTSIDSCDYSLEEYQAVEDPLKDPDFATFSLVRDKKYIIPMIKEAMAAGKDDISVLLSPWSPPYQWKTPPARPKNDAAVYGAPGHEGPVDYSKPGRNNGGSLKPEYYDAWARYLVKYVQAYLEEGIPVTMMTMQNESIAATNWDSCVWTAGDQKTFLTENLWPAFVEAGLDQTVGLFIWDHNKERVLEWSMDMIDATTDKMIAGIAFHWYSGDHFEAVQMTHEQFPGKTLMLSECCGLHKPGTASFLESMGVPPTMTPMHAEYMDAVAYAHDIIGNLNAGMNRWIDWNFCVDTTGGPRHVPGGFTAGMIMEDGHLRKNMTYYYVQHFSKYIAAGAKRIGLSRPDAGCEAAAAKNPDGSVVIVLLNSGEQDRFYAFRVQDKVVRFTLPKETITTIVI